MFLHNKYGEIYDITEIEREPFYLIGRPQNVITVEIFRCGEIMN
nr:MAG TPA: hypothetical protein [Caudoviricetes sp.]